MTRPVPLDDVLWEPDAAGVRAPIGVLSTARADEAVLWTALHDADRGSRYLAKVDGRTVEQAVGEGLLSRTLAELVGTRVHARVLTTRTTPPITVAVGAYPEDARVGAIDAITGVAHWHQFPLGAALTAFFAAREFLGGIGCLGAVARANDPGFRTLLQTSGLFRSPLDRAGETR